MQVTVGGNRVGSGSKMKAHLHNYFRSTHNLSERWLSSMGSGYLVPCFCKPAMRGDKFDININADVRTIPTKGPLFGSYKLQIDFYQCPIRLYQGILHNNPINIGMKMKNVMFPVVPITTTKQSDNQKPEEYARFSKSCLMKYLGISGIGVNVLESTQGGQGWNIMTREFNAIPMLAYYDIFKNYYANKQEEKAYVISGGITEETVTIESIVYKGVDFERLEHIDVGFFSANTKIYIEGQNLKPEYIYLYLDTTQSENDWDGTLQYAIDLGMVVLDKNEPNNIVFHFISAGIEAELTNVFGGFAIDVDTDVMEKRDTVKLIKFDLKNLDDMRYWLLCQHELGVAPSIDSENCNYEPYKTIFGTDSKGITLNTYPLNGLVLKTYQNDIYNNWLNKEWIEGENSVSAMSQVSVDSETGAFSMDALNFAQKMYNMLNRIAVAGATYEDWQDVVYEEVDRRQVESPIFIGGLSQEIIFDEVIQTAGGEDPLGTLGGRGSVADKSTKGGHIVCKCDEACFIIGIASLTPRIAYTQGNEFYMTDLLSMDDFHKPPMDGIGFQDLIGERLAWFDTYQRRQTGGTLRKYFVRNKIGKLPAWIEYMTSVNKAFGDLAEEYGAGFMILNRNYEKEDEVNGGIKDATTYIDPQKYNYAFAYTALDSQNFWVGIDFAVKARRLMSARLIPNV